MSEKGEKKVLRKRRGKKGANEAEEKLNKDETEVAKDLRWNMKTKKSSMFGDEVYYFIGSKIVDFMLESKWATGKAKKSSIAFTDRESTYAILDKMISLGLFSRVHRTYKEKEKKGKEKKDEKKTDSKEVKEGNKGGEVKDSPRSKKNNKGKESASKEDKDSTDGKKKKKVKVNLEPHEHNIFHDSSDAVYIWIYDPVHPKTFFLGILLVIGAVAVCLFPLWPESFRVYSWYLSVAAMIFLGAILFLALFRYPLFCILWGLSFGKLKFWLLPNLTADCGVQESFIPVYEYTFDDGNNSKDDDKDDAEDKEENEDNKEEGEQKAGLEVQEEKSQIEEKCDKDNTKREDAGQNSGSNKETDDGEAWVKVSKSDAVGHMKSDDIKC